MDPLPLYRVSMMSQRLITVGSVLVALVSLSLWAVEKHGGHGSTMDHSAMFSNSGQPTEGGQATFSALIEIIALLENDTSTDWANVNIDDLHSHLLDMNYLILETQTAMTIVDDRNIRFDISGNSKSIPSIHRMVLAHSRFVQQSRGWKIMPELYEGGATVTITVGDEGSLQRLGALGFYGFMSLDSHHQAHHYQIAIGQSH